MTGHVKETHDNCERTTCMVCDLFICKVCGGLEGALLPVCPGRSLTTAEHEANYAKYCAGTGPFARATPTTVAAALRVSCEMATRPTMRPIDNDGALVLFEAVAELFHMVMDRSGAPIYGVRS